MTEEEPTGEDQEPMHCSSKVGEYEKLPVDFGQNIQHESNQLI